MEHVIYLVTCHTLTGRYHRDIPQNLHWSTFTHRRVVYSNGQQTRCVDVYALTRNDAALLLPSCILGLWIEFCHPDGRTTAAPQDEIARKR